MLGMCLRFVDVMTRRYFWVDFNLCLVIEKQQENWQMENCWIVFCEYYKILLCLLRKYSESTVTCFWLLHMLLPYLGSKP